MTKYKSKARWEKKTFEHERVLSRHQGEGAFPVVLVLDHLKAGFNIGKIIRSAHAFGVREIHFVGISEFSPAPAKGTFRKTRTRFFDQVSESIELLLSEGYTLYKLEPDAPAVLGVEPLPSRSAFIMGHEEFGLSEEVRQYPQVRPLRIRQFGEVESLNVSVAASLALFEYLRQREFTPPQDWSPAPSLMSSLAVNREPNSILPLP